MTVHVSQLYLSLTLSFERASSFQTAHIWACPPGEGDDYIFHCHPIEQKIPKPKRLVDWYRKMLDRGQQSHVFVVINNMRLLAAVQHFPVPIDQSLGLWNLLLYRVTVKYRSHRLLQGGLCPDMSQSEN